MYKSQSNTNVRLIRIICLHHKRSIKMVKRLSNWAVLTQLPWANSNFERSKLQPTYSDLANIIRGKIPTPKTIRMNWPSYTGSTWDIMSYWSRECPKHKAGPDGRRAATLLLKGYHLQNYLDPSPRIQKSLSRRSYDLE